jgi:mannose-6-phosphate isomerase
VLDHEAPIYAGLRSGATAADVEDAVHTGKFEELVVKHAARPGDVLFIPGGLVHAIGAGARVYEVQQSSNTTYRLYDWGRVGVDGKPRTLHVAESLMTIDFSLPIPEVRTHVECPFFRFAPWLVSEPCEISSTADTFRVLYLESGSARLVWEDGEIPLVSGRAVLIPANVSARIEPCPSARILGTELGEFKLDRGVL